MSRNRELAGSFPVPSPSQEADPPRDAPPAFGGRFAELFGAHHARLLRVMNRLSGDPELAADVVQEAFVRLYRRGSLPDSPEAWLISVAMNRFRNEKTARSRRLRLLTPLRALELRGAPPVDPADAAAAEESHRRVRQALNLLPERERAMLLLQAEGYRYRDIAAALGLNEASVGVMLARARVAFRRAYEAPHASR
jgi:RNA polymerase sigma-70 factor (ECF subfamily)